MPIPEGGFPHAEGKQRYIPEQITDPPPLPDPALNPPIARDMDPVPNACRFEEALSALRKGLAVTRLNWNGNRLAAFKGKIMRLRMVYEWTAEVHWPEDTPEHMKKWQPFIVLITTDDMLVPWLASQTDLLAADWVVVS